MEWILNTINLVDGFAVLALFLGMAGGIRRGLSGELLRLASVLAAVIAGWKGAEQGAEKLSILTGSPPEELTAIAFFGIMIATFIFLGIIRFAMRLLLDFSFRGKLEIFGGALLGVLRATVFIAIVTLAITLLPSDTVNGYVLASRTGQWTMAYVRPLYDDIADKNPHLKLPELAPPATTEPAPELPLPDLELPAWQDYLGPLLHENDETESEP